MKKLRSKQVLVAKDVIERTRVVFYEVQKATTNTCELRELKKEIIHQTYDEQEVVPLVGDYASKSFRCKVLPTGCARIEDKIYAWPWDGKSQWQSIVIYIP
tara:strand:- start:56 stop:358 length:303 start_codon:yes stop_codon:yes gene_type:complete